MMPFVSVWLMLACLWQIQSSQGHPSDLHNVAYNKKVTLSSEYPPHIGSKAVNGLFDDLAHTDRERSPWLRIDLGRNYHIHEIEVFARRHCHDCGQQLHNIDVKVGKTKDSMRMCGHYSASARPGEQIPIWCPSGMVGRYVQVQIVRGEASYLSVAEVIVWGKRK
uniref:Fucolectin-7-like n=1 Tax=Crassostrea virginica TaxID=6565 RepID=A0A8B8BDT7_CRAVI|nr:fucolectin-7-like [Crassostrea virginica]